MEESVEKKGHTSRHDGSSQHDVMSLHDHSSHHDVSSREVVSCMYAASSVKAEPPDDDIFSQEEQAAIQIEVEIHPTIKAIVVKDEMNTTTATPPPDLKYVPRPCKLEPTRDTSGGSCWSEARDVYRSNEPHSACSQQAIVSAVEVPVEVDPTITLNNEAAFKVERDIEPTVVQPADSIFREYLLPPCHLKEAASREKRIAEAHSDYASPPSHSSSSEQSIGTVPAGDLVNRPHCCDICKKCFKFRSKLNDHIVIHTGEQPYCCQICQKRFAQSCNLITHMKLHSSERSHSCAICDKLFSRKSNLLRHLTTHTIAQLRGSGYDVDVKRKKCDAKPSAKTLHTCTVCRKEFSQKGNLNRHMITHTNERPYPCQFCQRSFTEMARLKAHVAQHTGKELYSCDLCSKNFSRKDHLAVHMNGHINKRSYRCEVCKNGYKQKSHLKSHMKTHRVKVSSEKAEAADVRSPEDKTTVEIEVEIGSTKTRETVVKEEMDIEPTMMRPPDIACMPRPFKLEAIENSTPG